MYVMDESQEERKEENMNILLENNITISLNLH